MDKYTTLGYFDYILFFVIICMLISFIIRVYIDSRKPKYVMGKVVGRRSGRKSLEDRVMNSGKYSLLVSYNDKDKLRVKEIRVSFDVFVKYYDNDQIAIEI